MNSQVLSINNVTKVFGQTKAMDGINFSINKGEFVVLLGAAGAGKTSTLRTVAGLEQPDSGKIFLSNKDVSSLQPKDRNVAMIFDSLALYPNKTGYENIAHPLRIRGLNNNLIDESVDNIATVLKIHHILKRLPKTMSGGERQRIALGRALVRDPVIFMLDEPLSSLDAKLRIELRAELKRLQQEFQHTFLLATPDYLEALAIADKVIMLVNGKIEQISSAQDLYDNPNCRDVATFVGSPKINLFDSKYSQNMRTLEFANISIAAPKIVVERLSSNSYPIQLGIRPEYIKLEDKGFIEMKISDIEPLGLKSIVFLENEHLRLHATMASKAASKLKINDSKYISFDTNKLLIFNKDTGTRLT